MRINSILYQSHCAKHASKIRMFMRYRWLVLLIGLLVITTGCQSSRKSSQVKPPAETSSRQTTTRQPSKRQIWVASSSGYLGQTQEKQIPLEIFIEKIGQYLDAERTGSAVRYVCRNPDVAVQALDRILMNSQINEVDRFVAAVYDLRLADYDAQHGWQALLDDQSEQISRYKSLRRRVMDHLDANQYKQAITLTKQLVQTADESGRSVLRLDARELSGSVLLADNRTEPAMMVFRKAATIFEHDQPYRASYLYILLCKMQQQAAPSQSDWQKAAVTAGRLLQGDYPVTDPLLWEAVIKYRPSQCQWPKTVINRMHHMNRLLVELKIPANMQTGSIKAFRQQLESLIWSRIGQWHVQREHYQDALVAFRTAQDLNHHSNSEHHLRLAQARMLMQMEQYQPAAAILTSVAGEADSNSASSATALLGVMQLQRNNLEQAVKLLEQATTSQDSTWPGIADAQGDLGLAQLMLGDEQRGLENLHNAQAIYRSQQDYDRLIESLNNEARYYLNTRNYNQAIEIQGKIDELEGVEIEIQSSKSKIQS